MNNYPPISYEEFTESMHIDMLCESSDDSSFWDGLARRLGERDFLEKYSADQIKKMSQEDRTVKLLECIDANSLEIDEYGIMRLRIVK